MALSVAFLMLTACAAQSPESGTADALTSSRSNVSVTAGTVWEAVSSFGDKAGGVWRYVYAAQEDEVPQWQVCSVYRRSEGSGVSAWYAADEPEVSVGVSEYVPDWLEITASGENGRMAGVQFVAPADGRYVLTGTLHNEWAEVCDAFTVTHGERVLLSQAVTAQDTPFTQAVDMKTGETLTMFARSPEKGNWLALYWQAQIEYFGRNET